MTGQRVTVAVGAGLVLVGAVLLAVGTPPWLPSLPDGGLGLLAFALVALLAASLGALSGAARTSDSPEPDSLPRVGSGGGRVAGEAFDRELAAVSGVADTDERAAIRDRLETVAVHTLTADGTDPETVRERLAEGTWTDDPRAGTFFADEGTGRTLRERVRAVAGGTPVFHQRVRRVIAELHRQATTDGSNAQSRSGRQKAEATLETRGDAVATENEEGA